MKKRSLAEAFQASLADEASGAAAAQHESDEEDYMSDAMLAMLERRDAPRLQTYSERRAQQQREEAERQRAEMQDAELRRSAKAGRPLAGEWAARSEGLATDRLAEAADRADRAQPLGAGTEAALRMMKAMGYVPGQALGAPEALDAPLAPDQRWLSADGRRKKLGIGHADLSRRIARAAEAPRSASPASDVAAFRQRQAEAAQRRHNEGLLRAARKACRECDEAHGWESVLAGENERGHDDAEALWLYALRDEGPPRAAPAPRERRVDAERFGALPLAARLALTVAYLREAYYYCVYCGHQYASESELQRSCPGPSEDEHG
ncbi:unnamed protein product [Malassezia sympodialis ATCC 42132]|uniref:uncharacterized protein n=1 Tax=Malassezia sympodialis (strain ATCC 42132) TaxID=1230383 RepID=UPI0002C2CB86|nr:uncharacterized protein MSY001_3445 [Malassezia sympodialis ATCC 42132]CCV00739.1 unnamed protein product [Malassezia sympodialis ATCC 42132]|eukprot:XP_018741916.1 uncharacterized protein MSY001_3445 [Malassezia sympodialis ATCC 42132]